MLRAPLTPQTWVDTQSSLTSFPNVAGGATSAPVGLPPSRPAEVDDELIPTAIVIKNIPFAVKKEQLVQLMTDLGLPLPYAFNYHFDSGVFRGLAFANFSSPDETSLVINMMNNFELQGRKLRVEYKKMLPQAERDRIEREKRERRGQLEEQHRPLPGHLQTQASYGSINSHMPATSPSPVSGRPSKLGQHAPTALGRRANPGAEVDMNDPVVLQFYTELVRFKDAADKESITFPPSLTPMQRRNVHMMAHQMGLAHLSKGNGEQRQVHVLKIHDTPNISPPLHASDQRRRSLNRSATTDFSDVRASDPYFNSAGPLARHTSALLAFPDSPGGLTALPNLRGAKSYADLRSITPSPAQSTASYPTVGPRNDFPFSTAASTAANVAVASTASPLAPRDEAFLVNGLSGLNVSSAFGQSSSPRSLRQMVSWDRENPGPIGGHRSFSTNYDEQARDRGQGLPSRQPRGPIPERGNGFVRARPNGHQGRGSDELSAQSAVEIVVEE